MSKIHHVNSQELHRIFSACDQKITTDTRNIEKGSLFFALKGANFNGNEFSAKALELGAAYCVVDEERYVVSDKCILVADVLLSLQELAHYHRSLFAIPIIGITGSNGKTTSKELIGAVLSQKYNVLFTQGNLNNHIGVPLTLLKLTQEHELAIIEMGANKPGDIAELCAIAAPNYGVITNIGKAHIEGFGSLEGVIKTKTELYQSIEKSSGILFVNADDAVLMQSIPAVEKITYGTNGTYSGKVVDLNPYLVFSWCTSAENSSDIAIQTHLVGDYNLPNFLLAVAIGSYFGVSTSQINTAFETYIPSNNRSQITQTDKNRIIVDCYNANVTSMELAIKNFAAMNIPGGWVIAGDMLELGTISLAEHQYIVDLVVKLQLNAYFVGNEFLKVTIPSNLPVFQNTEALQQFLIAHPIENTTVLLKGSRGIKLESLLISKTL